MTLEYINDRWIKVNDHPKDATIYKIPQHIKPPKRTFCRRLLIFLNNVFAEPYTPER